MAQKKKNKKTHHKTVMGRSDIPFAERLALQQHNAIIANREHSAKVTMYCVCVAIHELGGVGYKRIIEFARYFKTCIHEMYEDVEVGLVHAKQRLAQIGVEISGNLYVAPLDGLTKNQQDIRNHALQASQIALICAAIALNDFFGYGKDRLEKIFARVNELSVRYNAEGSQFLLQEMEKIGFQIIGDDVIAYADDDGTPIPVSAAKKQGIYTTTI